MVQTATSMTLDMADLPNTAYRRIWENSVLSRHGVPFKTFRGSENPSSSGAAFASFSGGKSPEPAVDGLFLVDSAGNETLGTPLCSPQYIGKESGCEGSDSGPFVANGDHVAPSVSPSHRSLPRETSFGTSDRREACVRAPASANATTGIKCRTNAPAQGTCPSETKEKTPVLSNYMRQSMMWPRLRDEFIGRFGLFPDQMWEAQLPTVMSRPFSFLPEEDGCQYTRKLAMLARHSTRLLRDEYGFVPQKKLPETITCGGLRSAIRSTFHDDLPEIVELSIKTSQKLEHRVCPMCEGQFSDFVNQWKLKRFEPCSSESLHIRAFRRSLSGLVERGWNRRPYPYVPNGHATLSSKRRDGGTWNSEQFQDWCRPECVISSGKPRVVTLYSEYNTRILTPLHKSLYQGLSRQGWILLGPPEDRHFEQLGGDGPIISLDYTAATDNIKAEYVRSAIEVLIEKSEGLSEEEVRCLRVLGELRLEPNGKPATRGQPMGSVMSFPLLCLINKTVQDLALTDLLLGGKISFKEWTSHRTLINGDDSVTREPRAQPMLLAAIEVHGEQVGLVVNRQKSSVAQDRGEINSTLFLENRSQKKTNLASLVMRPEVNDVLGFASESTRTLRGFKRVILRNRRILAKQPDKFLYNRPGYERAVAWADPRIAAALTSSPKDKRPKMNGYLAMSPRPEGFFLRREVEVETINNAVAAIRESYGSFAVDRPKKFRTSAVPHSHRPPIKRPSPCEQLILGCLANRFVLQQKENLRNEEFQLGAVQGPVPQVLLTGEFDSSVPRDTSKINFLVGMIRSQRKQKKTCESPQPASDFISFAPELPEPLLDRLF